MFPSSTATHTAMSNKNVSDHNIIIIINTDWSHWFHRLQVLVKCWAVLTVSTWCVKCCLILAYFIHTFSFSLSTELPWKRSLMYKASRKDCFLRPLRDHWVDLVPGNVLHWCVITKTQLGGEPNWCELTLLSSFLLHQIFVLEKEAGVSVLYHWG